MERLFNEYGLYTDRANAIHTEFSVFVKACLKKHGTSCDNIDLEKIMMDSIGYEMATDRIIKGTQRRKAQRLQQQKEPDEKTEDILTTRGETKGL